MYFRTIVLLSLFLLSLSAQTASAIILETKEGRQIGGYLVKMDEEQIVIRQAGMTGKDAEIVYDRDDVRIIHQLDTVRLAALSKDKPIEYRLYADELSPKSELDPEARDTARRLYLIAAYLDPENLAYSSMLSLGKLATTSFEARKFLAMAYLLDPKHDPNILKTQPTVAQTEGVQQHYQVALQLLRRGMTYQAMGRAQLMGVAEYFDSTGLMGYREFIDLCQNHPECRTCQRGWFKCPICRGRGKNCSSCGEVGWSLCPECFGRGTPETLSDDELRRVLRAELQGGPQTGWMPILNQKAGPIPALSLERLTEIDPRQCVYRDGKWVEP